LVGIQAGEGKKEEGKEEDLKQGFYKKVNSTNTVVEFHHLYGLCGL